MKIRDNIPISIRKCSVCLDKDVNTILIPCKHSIMCVDCLIQIMDSTNLCPCCRSFIDTYINEYSETEYADMSAYITNRVDNIKVKIHKKIYNKIIYVIIFGLVIIMFSVFCLFTDYIDINLYTKIIILLSGCFIMYFPWFFTTSYYFEKSLWHSNDDIDNTNITENSDNISEPSTTTINNKCSCGYCIKAFIRLISKIFHIIFFFIPFTIYCITWKLLITPIILIFNIIFKFLWSIQQYIISPIYHNVFRFIIKYLCNLSKCVCVCSCIKISINMIILIVLLKEFVQYITK